MANKYNSLEELRLKKKLLKKEVDSLEDLLTFDDTKASLSVLTHGFTDHFLKEAVDEDGEKSVEFKTKEIVDSVAKEVKNAFTKKDNLVQFATSELGTSIIENTIKLAIVGYIGKYVKKQVENTDWRKKLLGIAIIYCVPIILRYLREKLPDFQKNGRVSSLEQLI